MSIIGIGLLILFIPALLIIGGLMAYFLIALLFLACVFLALFLNSVYQSIKEIWRKLKEERGGNNEQKDKA